MRAPRRPVDATIVGLVLVALGALALREGVRLYRLREALVAGAVVGDDTFPLVVGLALVGLGIYLVGFAAPLPVKVEWPAPPVRARMLAGAGLLVAYWLLVPRLGYTASTGLVAIALYRALGGYRWPAALAAGLVSTGVLYLIFRAWLRQPLPGGLLGL